VHVFVLTNEDIIISSNSYH